MEKNKGIYLVLQTQPSSNYEQYPIYALSSRDKADEYARKLNKEFAKGVELSKDYDFIQIKDDLPYECIHYYEVLPLVIDEDLA